MFKAILCPTVLRCIDYRHNLGFFHQLTHQIIAYLIGKYHFLTQKFFFRLIYDLESKFEICPFWLFKLKNRPNPFKKNIEEYRIRITTVINDNFCLLSFLKHFIWAKISNLNFKSCIDITKPF